MIYRETPPVTAYGQNAASWDGVAEIEAGQAGIEPTTPGFGDRCSAKLSYWPVLFVRWPGEPPDENPWYLFELCSNSYLLGLAMQSVLPTAAAEFIQFDTAWIVATILLGRVIAFFTLRAGQCDNWANTLLGCHVLVLTARGGQVTPFIR